MFKLNEVVYYRGSRARIIRIVTEDVYVIRIFGVGKALVNRREIKKIED